MDWESSPSWSAPKRIASKYRIIRKEMKLKGKCTFRLPGREDVAKEMQGIFSTLAGKCAYRRSTVPKLGKYFPAPTKPGEEPEPLLKMKKGEIGKMTGKPPCLWPDFTESGSTRTGKSPQRVEKLKCTSQGGWRSRHVERLGLPKEIEELVVNMGNSALAQSTWRAYNTAERAVKRCEEDVGTILRMPWGEKEAIIFTWWLMKRNLASSTITQYFSGIRNAHKRANLEPKGLDSILVKTMLKGKSNTEEPRKQKIAMTPGLLLALKRFIIRCRLPLEDKLLVWAMCTLMYSGSLRGGEIMGEEDDEFDPRNILMEEDVRIKVVRTGEGRMTKMVSCIIKNPKELPGTVNLEIEMFKTEGKFCPVAAVEKLRRNRKGNKDKPFMTRKNGKIVTKKWLNGFLRQALGRIVDYEKETVSSHSFRAGVATAMARCGYSDEEIQRQGRWRSEAFLKYIRLGRSQRLEQQRTLAEKLALIAEAEVEERRAQ